MLRRCTNFEPFQKVLGAITTVFEGMQDEKRFVNPKHEDHM